jgi:hypothetical protein
MNLSQLELLIRTESVAGFCICRPDQASPWMIQAEFDDRPPVLSTWLESARRECRTFATVESALKVLRASGWRDPVKVDG